MNAINDTVLQLIQALVRPQTGSPAQREQSTEGTSFRDLMEQYHQASDRKEPGTQQVTQQGAEKPQAESQEGTVQGQDMPNLEQQMALAAMAVTVVPAQIVPEVQQTGEVETLPGVPLVQADSTVPVGPAPEGQSNAAAVPVLTGQSAAEQLPRAEAAAPQTAQGVDIPSGQARGLQSGQGNAADGQEPVMDYEVQQQEQGSDCTRLFDRLTAVPVKVGEPLPGTQEIRMGTPVQTEQTRDVGQQVLEPLTRALKQGDSRVVVQLEPETLGSVRIELTRHQDGALQIVLSASSSRTQELLEKHVSGLQTALLGRSEGPVWVEVQRQEGDQAPGDYPQENRQDGGQPQEQRQQQHRDSQDFMQQLRLGLADADIQAVWK